MNVLCSKRALAAGLIMAPLITGCFESSGRAVMYGMIIIRTGATRYALGAVPSEPSLKINVTLTNFGHQPVFMKLCGSSDPAFQLERRVGEDWQLAFQPVCPMMFRAPRRVESGETVRHVANINPLGGPGLSVEEMPGTYRLVYGVAAANGGHSPVSPERLLPAAERTSNEFTIVE